MNLMAECCFFSSKRFSWFPHWAYRPDSDFAILIFLCILTGTKASTMRYYVSVASVICVFILFSCGENEGGGRIETTRSASAPTLSAPANPSNNPSIQPVSNPSAPLIATGRVNPAHGQPGHRCDIAVGAPLPASSAPALNTNPVPAPVINTPSPTTPVTQPQPQAAATVASGLNPAHGQPGHRCDIPVGQPLSKAPAKPATTSSPVVTTTPAKPLVEAPDTMFAKGLNPAHGKPGHRCDIAVGQPLASAAKKDTAKAN